MKKLLLSALFLSSCDLLIEKNPDLKVGDCATIDYRPELEAWESKGPQYIFRVIEIGKRKYRVFMVDLEFKVGFEQNVYISGYKSKTDVYKPASCDNMKF